MIPHDMEGQVGFLPLLNGVNLSLDDGGIEISRVPLENISISHWGVAPKHPKLAFQPRIGF